ncbi:hypothetical protein Tco_0024292 [Tanacetum coccineum]
MMMVMCSDDGGNVCGVVRMETFFRRIESWPFDVNEMDDQDQLTYLFTFASISLCQTRKRKLDSRFAGNSVETSGTHVASSSNRPTHIGDGFSGPVDNSGSRLSRLGPPLKYKHIGSCEHCYGARFWYVKHIKDSPNNARPKYHRCCMAGRVVIRTYQIYPEYIQLLLRDHHFLENIRAYNQMFIMTSLGAHVGESINIGRGPYVFKILGQLYHWIGSLCPADGEPPRFLQLYIYDTDNEVDNRMHHFGGENSGLCRDIVEGLIELLDNHNALVQLFRTAREKLLESQVPPFKIRLYNVVGAHEYELPTGDMLGAIVYEAGFETKIDYDIIIEQCIGQPQRVYKLHPSYMSL